MKDRIIETAGGQEWYVLEETNLNDEKYLLTVSVDAKESKVTDEIKVFKKIESEGSFFLAEETDEDKLIEATELLDIKYNQEER